MTNCWDSLSRRPKLCEELAVREWKFASRPSPSVFVLVGPPASGKHAEALSAQEYPERPVLTLQMAGYQNEREGFGLIGLRPAGRMRVPAR